MGISEGFNTRRGGFVSAGELQVAVAEGFLSKEEARRVYWRQFDALRQAAMDDAVNNPPPLVAAAA